LERFGRIALKTILWIIASIIFLVLLVVILIQVPSVQNFVKDKAVTFIQGKIHTKVKIGHISLGLPKLIVLEDVYFEDQKKDTLIAGDKLKVDISLLKLLNHKVEVNEINLQGITANIKRGADSVFNFDYIIKAFASEQKKPVKPSDTTSIMKFSLDKIVLDKINVSYKDVMTGNDVKFLLGHFDTRIKDFDLDKMKFTIPKITVSGINARIIQTPNKLSVAKIAAADTAIAPINMTLNLGTIDFSKVKVDYRSNTMSTKVDLGKFLVEVDKIDLKNQKVSIKNIELNDTKAALVFAKPESVKKTIVKAVKKLDTLVASPMSGKTWRATLGRISFKNDNIKYDNNAQAPVAKGLDFGHMSIRDLNTDIQNLNYSADTISGKINSLTFNEKSGLIINKFHTAFLYGPKTAYLNNLFLQTPQTVIQKQMQVSYPSIASLSDDIGKLYINANLDGSRLGLKDVLLLMPSMAAIDPFKHAPNAVFRVNGRVMGRVNDLRIPSLEISGLSKTHIKASAIIKGLPDVNKSYFDLTIADFNTGSADIAQLVSPGMIPSSVSIPSNLNLKGTFKGSMKNFNTRMNLRSSLGAVDVVAAMKSGSRKGSETYSANIKAKNLNVGALIKQPQNVGAVTLTATIAGTGLDPKHANLRFSGDVASAQVKGYNYKNLVLKGTANNGRYAAQARMKDPNINFTLDGKADMNKKYPSINASLLVDSLNLQKLNFVNYNLQFRGKIVADVPTADPNYLNASIQATNLYVVNKDQRIKLDTVSLISTANADSSSLKFKTPFLYAHLGGKYKLTEIAPAVQDVVNKYFNTAMAVNKPTPPVKYTAQQFTFDIRLVKTPLLAQLAPTLKQLDPVLINGHFNSTAGDLTINGSMPKLVYGTTIVNNMKLAVNTTNALNYSITADQIKASSSVNILFPSISGSAQNNNLNVSLQVRDITKKERYRIAGVFSVIQNGYQFSFLQNGLLLNYIAWTVNANNALQFGNKGVLARNFAITNSNQVLSINSESRQMNSPITVNFNNFRIETLTTLAQQDSLQVGGVINGNAHISNFQKSPVFTAALNINDFNFRGDTVGNVALKVDNQTQNAYAATVNITGKGNQVNLTGLYYTTPASTFDLNLDIVALNMKSIQGFSYGSIRNSTGKLSGQLKITGSTSAPVIRGDITVNKVGFNVSTLNSYFTMPNESITFNNDGIRFNDFTLVDSTGNKATVTGTLYTKNYADYKFSIDITMDNFRVVNSTQADNKLYYGKLYMDSRVKIRGDMNKPVVDAELTVNDKTDLTVVLPTNDPGVEDRKGVVEFIDQRQSKEDSLFLAKQLDSLKKSSLTGLDINATINISKKANFTIVIDERNGDIVQLKGEAHLNGGIDPSGKVNLTGTYVVSQGSYNLSYATVTRKFNFKPGSTITWTGDPTSANIDLTAIYVANVPPIDLVNDQLGSTENATMYKQKLPFNVDLSLKNDLLKPDISFDIVLPDSTYTVSQDVINTVNLRLSQIRQDPNEMNKQVLGVLVLGHFIGDNPLQSLGGGTGLTGAIRNSVSSLLSDQLNKLAGNLIGGVQLSFDLTSGADYATGTQQNRTDLNVGLSKQFLNDRVTVTIGNNFNLEGQNQPGQKTTDIAGNLSVNYKLTKDGRYVVRVYRRDQFIVVQGQVVETGVGFSLTYEYNKFMELFAKKPKEQKALDKKYREDQKEQTKEKKEADKKADSTAMPVQPANKPKPNQPTLN
jgi:hypothetical protein